MSPDSPSHPPLPRAFLLVSGGVLAVAAGAALYFARSTGLLFLRPLAMLAGWAALVTLVRLLASLPAGIRAALTFMGAVAVMAIPGLLYLPSGAVSTGATEEVYRLMAVIFAVLTFSLHFVATLGAHTGRERSHPALEAVIPLCRLISAAMAIAVVAVLARLYWQRNFMEFAHGLFAGAMAVLLAESTLQFLARLYQPKRLRTVGVLGNSVLLPTLFGQAGPLRSLSATLEKVFGVRLVDTWLVRLGASLTAPLLLAGLVLGWLSTAATRVPVDSRGVLVSNGAFDSKSLAPGLHFHAPWPWGRVAIVPTARVQEFSVGFERDLAGPILWAEKHFEGEQNLLVGGGEELLTVNVPVQYRVKDAVSFLKNTTDPRAALEALSYHELLRLTGDHTAFGLMTTDREEISSKLRTSLQAASDQLQLGVEIVFVGLKDVHPPVPVVPAYQDVVSAEEQHESLVDQARSYSVATAAQGRIAAEEIRLQADTAAHGRQARATGESARFLAPLGSWREHPEVFATRLRLETVEASLNDTKQLYLLPAGAKYRSAFLPGSSAPSAPQAISTPAPSNSPAPSGLPPGLPGLPAMGTLPNGLPAHMPMPALTNP